jgi:hypothetical protein
MRLYGYLSTKDELLDLMMDAVYAEITPPDSGVDWRDALRSLANQTRQLAARHEWFADLLGRRPSLGPHALARLEATLAALARGGMSTRSDRRPTPLMPISSAPSARRSPSDARPVLRA